MASIKQEEEEKLSKGVEEIDLKDEKKIRSVILHQTAHTVKADQEEREFIQKLKKYIEGAGLSNVSLDVKEIEAEPGKPDLGMLGETLKNMKDSSDMKDSSGKSGKVILAFPDKDFIEAEIDKIVKLTLEKKLHFVTIILYTDVSAKLPIEVTEFRLRRVDVDRDFKNNDVEAIANDLLPFIKDEPETVDLGLMNAGTGLAWSYYFGYLRIILPDFEELKKQTLKTREEFKKIPEDKFSSKMLVVYSTDCREPEAMRCERVKFMINKIPLNRAGIQRNIDFDFRQIFSKDGKESYYAVVYYLNILQALREMNDDNKEFSKLTDEKMKKEGRICFLKLKLFLKYMRAYNQKAGIDPSIIQLMEHDPKKETTNELVDRMFDCIKCPSETGCCILKSCKSKTDCYPPKSDKPGLLCFEEDKLHVHQGMKEFIKSLGDIQRMELDKDEVHAAFDIIQSSSRIVMVLDEEFLNSVHFEYLLYKVLDYNLCQEKPDKRSVVILDTCPEKSAPFISDLDMLFSYVNCKDSGWREKANTEFRGDPMEINYDLKFLVNIGTGLACSWYYRYLKIRVPKIVDLVQKCKELEGKYKRGLLSYKLFILHPQSCHCPQKISDFDPCIVRLEGKILHIMKGDRDYTPTLYAIKDKDDGKEYYAFVEYNTQASTMYKMKEEGFLTESRMCSEWERFYNKLKMIITHPKEPMKMLDRLRPIDYDDKNMKEGDLAALLLEHIKYEINQEQQEGKLPDIVDNGATIEKRDWAIK